VTIVKREAREFWDTHWHGEVIVSWDEFTEKFGQVSGCHVTSLVLLLLLVCARPLISPLVLLLPRSPSRHSFPRTDERVAHDRAPWNSLQVLAYACKRVTCV
jgi:hypothetical protein